MVFSNNLLMGAAGQGGGYEIDQSIRFNDGDSAKLTGGTGQTGSGVAFTLSAWIKRGTLTATTNGSDAKTVWSAGNFGSSRFIVRFGSGGSGTEGNELLFSLKISNSWTELYTNQLFRDVGGWYHLVIVWDTANATAGDRRRIYVNGERVTSFKYDSGDPSLNLASDSWNNASYAHIIGMENDTRFFDGYLAELYHIDGQALTAASFGETNDDGVWVPKNASSLTFGTRGWYLKGQDSSALGDDTSGNGNDFTSSGLTTADQMLDTPTNSFWTLNPTDRHGSNVTILDGNLRADCTSSAEGSVFAPMLPKTGKWAWKITATLNMGSGAEYPVLGIVPSDNADLVSPMRSGGTGEGYGADGRFFSASAGSNSSYGATWADGDVIEVGWDADNGTLSFWHNGSAQGAARTGLTGRWKPAQDHYSTAGGDTLSDFGQSGYTPTDSSYKTLCTANLPTPSITDGSKYFQPTLYEGNGSTQSINQAGNSTFQPDWVWIKNRDASDAHALFDAVRGATEVLSSNATTTEATNDDTLTGFESDGFALGDDVIVNTNNESYVAWQWLANGSGSSNEDGSINTTSTSVNTTAGFSISTYTGNATVGATVGHGLGVAPKMVIVKSRSNSENWIVGNDSMGWTKAIYLNSTSGPFTLDIYWNNTAPTSSVVELHDHPVTNGSGYTYVMYSFAEIPGYSSFSSYTGNGSTDGAFVYTGFKPSFVLLKRLSTQEWQMYDTERDPFNVSNHKLEPNSTSAESVLTSDNNLDFLSNGFKLRKSNGGMNASGSTYIYMAFAENPFGGDGVAPATAR